MAYIVLACVVVLLRVDGAPLISRHLHFGYLTANISALATPAETKSPEIVMGCIVMAHIVMAHIVMAYVVTSRSTRVR